METEIRKYAYPLKLKLVDSSNCRAQCQQQVLALSSNQLVPNIKCVVYHKKKLQIKGTAIMQKSALPERVNSQENNKEKDK